MNTWRRWNRAIHRDVGYFTAGLTAIYAISGIAVNHTQELNPSYQVERSEQRFEPIPVSDKDQMVALLVERLALPGPPKESFRARPEALELFYQDFNVKAEASSGQAVIERSRPRFLLREMNTLHLNRIRGAWTWIADAFGGLLLFLALSGLVMLRGKDGLLGRGKWLVAIGVAIPLFFVWLNR